MTILLFTSLRSEGRYSNKRCGILIIDGSVQVESREQEAGNKRQG